MSDPLADVLQLVADGHLTAEEAEPILAALELDDDEARSDRSSKDRHDPGDPERTGRTIRLEITDGGRVAVNLRLPASLGDFGLQGLPGLSRPSVERIRAALKAGTRGPVFEAVDEDGDGVRIVID